MIRLFSLCASFLCLCCGCAIVAGCVSQKSIDSISKSQAWRRSVPDSLLSSIRVYISQANEGKKWESAALSIKRRFAQMYVTAAEKWSDALVPWRQNPVLIHSKTFLPVKNETLRIAAQRGRQSADFS